MSLVEYTAVEGSTDEQRAVPSRTRRRSPIGAEPEPDWRDSAACVGVDLNLFFPISTVGAAARAQITEAKAVCGRCPVQQHCLAWALAVGPEFGVFGGHTEDERRRLRQGLSPRPRISAVIPNPCTPTSSEVSELN